MKQLILCFLLISATSMVNARGERFYTGTELKTLCAAYSDQCLQYVAGVFDGFSMVYGWLDTEAPKEGNKIPFLLPEPLYCPPREIRTQTLRDIVLNYLDKHPRKVRIDANQLVYMAVLDAYPCEES